MLPDRLEVIISRAVFPPDNFIDLLESSPTGAVRPGETAPASLYHWDGSFARERMRGAVDRGKFIINACMLQ